MVSGDDVTILLIVALYNRLKRLYNHFDSGDICIEDLDGMELLLKDFAVENGIDLSDNDEGEDEND